MTQSIGMNQTIGMQPPLSGAGPLAEINEAFDRLDRGEAIRHVVVMDR